MKGVSGETCMLLPKLLQLYKLGWNEIEVRVVSKPDYVTVSKSAMALVAREKKQASRPLQLSLFNETEQS